MVSKAFNNINYSAVDSNRFGLRIFRDGVKEQIDSNRIRDELRENNADIYIFRVPAKLQPDLHRLNKLGHPFIIADTLVSYTCDLDSIKIENMKNRDLTFEVCSPQHKAVLKRMTGIIFKGYQNHYTSNPLLKKEDILDG